MGKARRSAVAIPLLLSLTISACADGDSAPTQEAEPAPTAPPPPPVSHVQVAAHPDDDILFMNPDLAAGIRARQPTAGIFLTGGEGSMPNPNQYVAQRQEGTRAAYAHMAGVADEWEKTRIPVAGQRSVEMDTLKARPQVRLVFLNLPEDQDGAVAGGEHALIRLWRDRDNRTAVRSLVPDTATVRTPHSYDHGAVVRVLDSLFDRFRPTTIKVQDSQPDARYEPQWVGFHNHPDHVVGAKFAGEAAGHYMQRTGMPATLLNYRDYNNADMPVNLSHTDRADKREHFARYVPHDSEASLGGAYPGWISRSHYRWPRGTQWAESEAQGRQHAFVVQGGQIAHWSREPDGRWRPPEHLRTPGPIRPTLRAVRGHDGRLALFAQSWDGARVLVKHQAPSGDWPEQWQDLGNPGPSGQDSTQVGTPSVTVDRNGQFVVVVKDAGGGISALRQANGPGRERPSTWRNVGGHDVQDNPAVVVDGDGQLQVFAATRDRFLQWSEGQPGTALSVGPRRFGTVRPAGPPRAVRMADGGVRLVVRTPGDGGVAVFNTTNPSTPVEQLPNPGGMTTPAAMPTGDASHPNLVLIARDSNGNARVSGNSPGQHEWLDTGGRVLDHPTPSIEHDGRVTLFAVGVNGELLTNPQDARTTSFTGWQPATSVPGSLPAARTRAEARMDATRLGANGAAGEQHGR